mmetsp:Transcript_7126/g.27982  ORF Transcript_7126/g.27982 Transcript_7126/m.27982 type:complete len:259 (-) Transcript_7126:2324-3100(-)
MPPDRQPRRLPHRAHHRIRPGQRRDVAQDPALGGSQRGQGGRGERDPARGDPILLQLARRRRRRPGPRRRARRVRGVQRRRKGLRHRRRGRGRRARGARAHRRAGHRRRHRRRGAHGVADQHEEPDAATAQSRAVGPSRTQLPPVRRALHVARHHAAGLPGSLGRRRRRAERGTGRRERAAPSQADPRAQAAAPAARSIARRTHGRPSRGSRRGRGSRQVEAATSARPPAGSRVRGAGQGTGFARVARRGDCSPRGRG